MTNNGAICNVMCPAELMHNFSVQMCAYDNDAVFAVSRLYPTYKHTNNLESPLMYRCLWTVIMDV